MSLVTVRQSVETDFATSCLTFSTLTPATQNCHRKLKVSNQGIYSSQMIGQLIFNFSGYTKMRLPNLVEHDTLHEVNSNL